MYSEHESDEELNYFQSHANTDKAPADSVAFGLIEIEHDTRKRQYQESNVEHFADTVHVTRMATLTAYAFQFSLLFGQYVVAVSHFFLHFLASHAS